MNNTNYITELKDKVFRFTGCYYSNNEVAKMVKEYNDFKMPISHRIMQVNAEPSDFIRFIVNKTVS